MGGLFQFPFLFLPLLSRSGGLVAGGGDCECDPVSTEVQAGTIGNPARLRFWIQDEFTLALNLTPEQDISTWTLEFVVTSQNGSTVYSTKTPDEVDYSVGQVSVHFDAGELAVRRYRFQYRRIDAGDEIVLRWGYIEIEQ
jgi:hypothetical protein